MARSLYVDSCDVGQSVARLIMCMCVLCVVHRDPRGGSARSDRSHHICRSVSHHGTMFIAPTHTQT